MRLLAQKRTIIQDHLGQDLRDPDHIPVQGLQDLDHIPVQVLIFHRQHLLTPVAQHIHLHQRFQFQLLMLQQVINFDLHLVAQQVHNM